MGKPLHARGELDGKKEKNQNEMSIKKDVKTSIGVYREEGG